MDKLILAIANANKIHDEAVEGNQGGQYKIGSKTILKTAITTAQQVVDSINSTTLTINTATTDLDKALINFQNMKIIIVTSEINELILNANKLHDGAVEGSQKGQYKNGSKAILKTAITTAQQVVNNSSSTQADIDTAIVNAAISNFEKMKNTVVTSEMNKLILAIANANKIHDEAVEGNQGGQYKIGSKTILKTAITTAQQVVDSINSTILTINTATTDLDKALINFQNMKIIIETSEINELILNANKLHDGAVEGSRKGQYKNGSKAILKTAITTAQEVVNNSSSTQADIDTAIVSLNAAISNFEKMKITVITSEMNKLILAIANANKIHNEAVEGNQGGQYKIGSKVILKTAIVAAQQVVDNINSTTLTINTATTDLDKALISFQNMKIIIESSEINELILNANKLHDGAVEGSQKGNIKMDLRLF